MGSMSISFRIQSRGLVRKTMKMNNRSNQLKKRTIQLELKASPIKNEERSVLSQSDFKFDKEGAVRRDRDKLF
jgi:hypothetical protein